MKKIKTETYDRELIIGAAWINDPNGDASEKLENAIDEAFGDASFIEITKEKGGETLDKGDGWEIVAAEDGRSVLRIVDEDLEEQILHDWAEDVAERAVDEIERQVVSMYPRMGEAVFDALGGIVGGTADEIATDIRGLVDLDDLQGIGPDGAADAWLGQAAARGLLDEAVLEAKKQELGLTDRDRVVVVGPDGEIVRGWTNENLLDEPDEIDGAWRMWILTGWGECQTPDGVVVARYEHGLEDIKHPDEIDEATEDAIDCWTT